MKLFPDIAGLVAVSGLSGKIFQGVAVVMGGRRDSGFTGRDRLRLAVAVAFYNLLMGLWFILLAALWLCSRFIWLANG